MDSKKAWALIRFAITALVLFCVWLLFTASLETFSLVSGALGALLIAWSSHGVFIASHEVSLNSFMPRPLLFVAYLGLLLWELYVASFIMLVAVVRGPAWSKIHPRIVHFKTRMKSDLGRMVLANSITLTPGSITLDLDEDHLVVHWFFCQTSNSRAAGEAVKGRLEALLGKVWQ